MEMDTPCTSILLEWKGIRPARHTVLLAGEMDTPRMSILLAVEGETPCMSMLLTVERDRP